MNGRMLQINIISTLLWVVLLVTSGPLAAAERPVVVLLSGNESAYSHPVETFKSAIQQPVKVYNLKGSIDHAPQVMSSILSENPALIFALGAKAAYVAKIWTADRHDIPVLFAMVLNWQKYNLLAGQDNIAGIGYDLDPGIQFANLSLLTPKVKRLGVIYSREYSSDLIKDAEKAAARLGITLIAEQISSPDDLKQAYRKMADRIDGLWVIADPVVYTLNNVSWLERECIKERLVCLGPSKNVASVGVLLAADPDQKGIGIQAASLANNIVAGKMLPHKIGVMSPLGAELYLNMKTARKIDLAIQETALDLVRNIID